jgi:hypothetical protein
MAMPSKKTKHKKSPERALADRVLNWYRKHSKWILPSHKWEMSRELLDILSVAYERKNCGIVSRGTWHGNG